MLNWPLMARWENWVTVFLMFAIGMLGIHIFVDFVDSEEN